MLIVKVRATLGGGCGRDLEMCDELSVGAVWKDR